MTLTARCLADLPHGFSDRTPLEPHAIRPGAPLLLAKQIHSARVSIVIEPWAGPPPEADALVTATPGLLIGVVTADCAPILLADRDAGVVAAAHAGWRGALGGIVAATVAAMEALGARRETIAAAIGPTIAQASYEVDAGMRGQFPGSAHRFFAPSAADRWRFDLPGFVADALGAEGVGTVEDLGEDTYAKPERFFSFRRATHQVAPTGGRQVSCIAAG